MFNISRFLSRKLQAIGVLLATSSATVVVAQSVPAPVLIPYTVNVLAGNAHATAGGYSGDGGLAVSTYLNAPLGVATDPEGNVYIADTANAVIREVNAQTGVIKIIAGLPPTKCALTLCTAQSGYTDNVLATSAAIGTGAQGIAVDGYGNVFFGDYNQQVVRVIYKGGTQVANLIALEDPGAAPTASAVVPGNVYLVAGTYNTKGNTDKVLATKGTMHDPGSIQLDGAGNIYFEDFGNDSVRVINTQSTAQTFFGVTLQPGYMGAIMNCGSLTTACGSTFTGVPAGVADYGADIVAQGLGVDQYGNLYEVNSKSAPAIFGAAAYTGNGPLGNLLTMVDGHAPVPGDLYNVINGNPAITIPAMPLSSPFPTALLANQYNNIVLRATAIVPDPLGNLYYMDNHFPWIFRIDVNSQVGTRMTGFSVTAGGTATTPVLCNGAPVFPVVATDTSMTTDVDGDGCPVTEAVTSGTGAMTTDGAGNLYIADKGESLIRKVSINNQFPATPVGTPVTQTLQVHFDQTNLPITTTATTTSPLNIQTGNLDYTIATAPTCQSNTISTPNNVAVDSSIDCVVAVTFTPTQPGLRKASLQATVASGTVYNISLTGIGTGSALALDGGGQSVLAATGLGAVTGIAIDAVGDQYIADPANNRVVELPVTCSAPPCTQITVGTGLSSPQGVAVDAANNVYIADTGNNRIVEVSSTTGTQTVLGSGLLAPQGVAVDQYGNVYVADTGNKRVVEISANPMQAQSVFFQFNMTTPVLASPVAVAIDSLGNVYVSDSSQKAVYEIPPGGGDLQNIITTGTTFSSKSSGVSTPAGLAVDAAGDLYVSDTTNNVVVEVPSSSGPGSSPFDLSFTGLSNPGGVALDASGNVYVADTGNSRALMMNRTTSTVNFGTLGVFQPALTAPLTLSNIGNLPVTLAQPVYTASGSTADFSFVDGCSGVLLYNGLTCSVAASFLPVASATYSDTLAFVGGITANLQGIGVAPLASIDSTFSQAPVLGGTTAAVVATVTQPHGVNIPTGTVTFVYTINEGNTARGGSTATVTVPLVVGSGNAATAILNLTGLLPARRYSVVATYNGDAGDSANTATALTFTVPGGTTLTVVSSSASFVYGAAVPALTGTVTGILPADAPNMTYSFVTTATPITSIGSYPITLLLSGGNYLNYVVPPAVTTSGAPAVVTETPAPLIVKANNFTVVYGSQNISPSSVVTGAVNGDNFTINYTPSATSVLDVGTYSLVPTVTGTEAGNYTISITNGALTVTQAATSVSLSANAAAVLPTNLPSEQVAITVGSGVSNSAIPSGTVTLIDTFTPFSTGVANAPVNIGPLTLTNGATTYTPTSTSLGTHAYTATYSGSLDFQTSNNTTATNVIVDHPDFFVTAPTTPIVIIPGTLPGGNQAVTGESSANPEQATVTLSPILNYTGVITLSCSSPSSYVTCGFSSPTVTITTTTAQTAVISVQTPATLPTNYSSGLTMPTKLDYRFAFLLLGLLALLPLARSRGRRLTRYVWLLLLGIVMGLGASGCTATNLVKFYTPVPEGEQPLTITATDGTITQTFTMTISIQ